MAINKQAPAATGVVPGGSAEFIRGWSGLCAEIGKSRVQIWRDIRAGRFPQPLEYGENSLARMHRMKWRSASSARQFSSPDQTLTLDQVAEF